MLVNALLLGNRGGGPEIGGTRMTTGVACGSCGTGLRENAKFCDECGAPTAVSGDTAEFKQVTVLFADVVRSMDIAATVDMERLREIITELVERSAAVVQRYGGTVEFTGDGVMALFGAPMALEDHAFRGCLAALAIQEETNQLEAEVQRRDGISLRLRVGLNSGRVIAGEIGSGFFGYTALGEQVGMAQRMESVAPPGGVLLSESTARLVEHLAVLAEPAWVRIKGADEPVRARRLLAIGPRDGLVGRAEASLVGRRWEMAAVEALVARTIGGRGGVVNVVGPPGIGKSRVAREAAAAAADRGVEVFWAFCESHARDIPFGVVAQLLRADMGVADLDGQAARARVREQLPDEDPQDLLLFDDLLGIADPEVPVPAIDPAARRRRLTALINTASLARTEPALFIIEDAHWVDAVSESMLADFLSVIPRTPSMVLITSRPEYEGALMRVHGAQTIALAPLGAADTTALLGELLGSDPSVGELAAVIAERAAGNPFFAEEMVRELAQRGVLAGEHGGYICRSDIADIAVPATVQAAIEVRIDRLTTPAKRTLHAASVIGTRFDVDTLQALVPDVESTSLAELASAELIDQTEFIPRQRYCFHHPLVRTVAYESQLRAARARAHRRLAAAIEARNPSAADENAVLIATHLEAAGELAQAYRWHLRAAEWLRPRDLLAARAEWETAHRIADRLPDDHDDVIAMRIAPRTMLMSTSFYVGDDVDTDDRYREFRDLAMQTGDIRSLALATAGRIQSFAVNGNRVPEAASLATELEHMTTDIDCDTATKSILLNAVAMARFVNCEFEAALQVVDAILALPQEVPAVEIALASAIRGSTEICLGDYELGRRHLRERIKQARSLPPVVYAEVLFFSGAMVALGMSQADDLVDDVREALRRAESFGDISGIIPAQYSYGIVLLRAENGSPDEAIDVLERVRTSVQKHKMFKFAAATIDAVLEIDAARRGQPDEAIDVLRSSFSLHMASGSRVFVGCAGEALVGLLIERGSTDDLIEAHRIVDEWKAQRPGIPALDLWWLKSRALLAKSEGDFGGYAQLAKQYLSLCEKLDAEGRLFEARRMVNTSIEQPRQV
jgi:adenylate cyclase